MKQLFIFRGPSGSGKTTAAKKILGRAIVPNDRNDPQHFEADSYLYERDGVYRWAGEKLGHAYKDCERRMRQSMEKNRSPLVVSNTTMKKWEVEQHVKLAEEYGYEVIVYKTKGPWDPKVLAARNLHNLTAEMIQRQINKYQPIEGEIEYE